MTRVILDTVLREKLLDLAQPLELCDESGQVLAHLLPAINPAVYEGLEPQINREELQRRKQNKGKTYTTAEVLARLVPWEPYFSEEELRQQEQANEKRHTMAEVLAHLKSHEQ